MVNKKGQEMSVATLVLIVVGVVMLVILIMGFTMGWGNLWNKVNIFGGGSSVSEVIKVCQMGTTKFDLCDTFNKVTIGGVKQYINCQYDAVKSNLESAPPCDRTALESAKAYCQLLLDQAKDKTIVGTNEWKNTLYNGQSCSQMGVTTPTAPTA
jgi:hypothetical protein